MKFSGNRTRIVAEFAVDSEATEAVRVFGGSGSETKSESSVNSAAILMQFSRNGCLVRPTFYGTCLVSCFVLPIPAPVVPPMASLQATINQYQFTVPESSYPALKHYCQAVWEINQSLNLTRHTTYEKFVTRDLLDTLELSKLIPEGNEVLDIGSGGGVPGMILAILRPDLQVSLSESVGKKAAALGEIAESLNLPVAIYQARAEELLEDFRFDYCTARAVGPLKKLGTWLSDVWPAAGRLLAVKGPNWIEEKNEAHQAGVLQNVDLRVVSEYAVPGVDWKSVILQLKASS